MRRLVAPGNGSALLRLVCLETEVEACGCVVVLDTGLGLETTCGVSVSSRPQTGRTLGFSKPVRTQPRLDNVSVSVGAVSAATPPALSPPSPVRAAAQTRCPPEPPPPPERPPPPPPPHPPPPPISRRGEAVPRHPALEPRRRPQQKTACFPKAITQAAEDVKTMGFMRRTPQPRIQGKGSQET